MKSPDDAHFQLWAENPMPLRNGLSGRIIMESQSVGFDAYLWSSENCSDGWLAYNGPMEGIHR